MDRVTEEVLKEIEEEKVQPVHARPQHVEVRQRRHIKKLVEMLLPLWLIHTHLIMHAAQARLFGVGLRCKVVNILAPLPF